MKYWYVNFASQGSQTLFQNHSHGNSNLSTVSPTNHCCSWM
jgi:hypothetical protein